MYFERKLSFEQKEMKIAIDVYFLDHQARRTPAPREGKAGDGVALAVKGAAEDGDGPELRSGQEKAAMYQHKIKTSISKNSRRR